MPYTRFLQVARVAAEERREEERAAWTQTMFVAYQVYLTRPLKKGHVHMTFQEWLKRHGLATKPQQKTLPKLTPEEAAIEREAAIRKAEQIVQMDQANRKTKAAP